MLEQLQRAAFDYFPRSTNPKNGLVADRTGDGAPSSIAIVVRDGSDKILGATIVARHAGEMINEISLAMGGRHRLAEVGAGGPRLSDASRSHQDGRGAVQRDPADAAASLAAAQVAPSL